MNISFNVTLSDGADGSNEAASNYLNAMHYLMLRPIALFWDLENVHVPSGKSVLHFVQKIRTMFCRMNREAQFMCILDVNKEKKNLIKDLQDAQVTLVHITATSKNAADEKIKQLMRQFVDFHAGPATLLLISNDVNFATDLSDFKNRHKYKIILIHNGNINPALEIFTDEQYTIAQFTEDLPNRYEEVIDTRPHEVIVSNLPIKGLNIIRNKLHHLSANSGGKITSLKGKKAILRFPDANCASRGKKRLDKEIVFGKKIKADFKRHTKIKSHVQQMKNSLGIPANLTIDAQNNEKKNPVIKNSPPLFRDAYSIHTVATQSIAANSGQKISAKYCKKRSSKEDTNTVYKVSPTSLEDVHFIDSLSANFTQSLPENFSSAPVEFYKNDYVQSETLECNSVELYVSNLDEKLELNELKNLLFAVFSEHVKGMVS